MKPTLFALAAAAAAVASAPGQGGRRTYAVDRAHSHATITVGKTGIFSFAAGHTHVVSVPAIDGTIVVDRGALADSTVHLSMDARTLEVNPKGEPPKDVPQVQQAMLSEKVLDVARYPSIVFDSSRATVSRASATDAELTIAGTLTLHGVRRPVTAPTRVHFDASALTATGRITVRQSEFGIKPVSVGGVVSVKDALEIAFTIVARERSQ